VGQSLRADPEEKPMPSRRDYADAWRDSWATLLQVPVAGLLAADYLYQQWIERSSTYLMHVSTRLALARPAAAADASPEKSVMADVLSEDLIDATRALVRDLVSLPGESAMYFNRHLATRVREILARVQPDAQTDVRTYVMNQLEELNRELYRLREVATAERVQKTDVHVGGPTAAEDLPQLDQMLNAIQERIDGALKDSRRIDGALKGSRKASSLGIKPNGKGELSNRALSPSDQTIRARLAIQRALDEIEAARQEIQDQVEGATRPRARRESGQGLSSS